MARGELEKRSDSGMRFVGGVGSGKESRAHAAKVLTG